MFYNSSPNHIVHDYSCTHWNCLCNHMRDVPWEDIFQLSASATASEFCEWLRLELMYMSLIVSNRSSLLHLNGFQLFVLLP